MDRSQKAEWPNGGLQPKGRRTDFSLRAEEQTAASSGQLFSTGPIWKRKGGSATIWEVGRDADFHTATRREGWFTDGMRHSISEEWRH